MTTLMRGATPAPAIFAVNTYTNYTSSDYNGFRVNPGAATSFEWDSPVWSVAQDYRDLLAAEDGQQVPPANFLLRRRYAPLPPSRPTPHHATPSLLPPSHVFP